MNLEQIRKRKASKKYCTALIEGEKLNLTPLEYVGWVKENYPDLGTCIFGDSELGEEEATGWWTWFNAISSKKVVCYLNKDGVVRIIRIYDNPKSSKADGFDIDVKTGEVEQGGFWWTKFNNFMCSYPKETEDYLKTLHPLLPPQKREHYIGAFKDSTIIRSYSFLEEVILDGFDVGSVQNALVSGEKYKGLVWKETDIEPGTAEQKRFKLPLPKWICYDGNGSIVKMYTKPEELEPGRAVFKSSNRNALGYSWCTTGEWKEPEKIEEYEKKVKLGYIPALRRLENSDQLSILQCDKEDNVIDIFKSLHDVPRSYGAGKIMRQEEREVGDFRWYRVNEYLEKYPQRKEYLERSLDIVSSKEVPQMKILLTISSKLISVNELYKARVSYTAGGRAYPVLYKNPKAQKVSQEVRQQLLMCDFKKYIPWLNKTKKYNISIHFILKSGITRRDCANFEKIMCDDLTRFIKNDLGIEHFDDSEFYECTFVKSIVPNAQHEYAFVVLEESYHQERLDIIQKPSHIYLAGNMRSSFAWRERFTEIAELDYYDPREDILNPDQQEREKIERDTILYVLAPGDYNEELGCEIIKCCSESKKFVVIAVLGDETLWGKDDFKKLVYLQKSIKTGSKIKFDWFESIEEINDLIKNLEE